MIGGCPAPASIEGLASASDAVWAVLGRAPTPPLTSTMCTATPANGPLAMTCTALAPPVQIGSPTVLAGSTAPSGPWPRDPAETQGLQRPAAPLKRSRMCAPGFPSQERPSRSAGAGSSSVSPPAGTSPTWTVSSLVSGIAAVAASPAGGRSIPAARAPAPPARSDLRVRCVSIDTQYSGSRRVQRRLRVRFRPRSGCRAPAGVPLFRGAGRPSIYFFEEPLSSGIARSASSSAKPGSVPPAPIFSSDARSASNSWP